jgi:hypothetical protein
MPQTLNVLDEEETEEDKSALHDRIQALEQQVQIQLNAIAQASKALVLCESTYEFSNSTENVEGERALFIASKYVILMLFYLILDGHDFLKMCSK